MATPTTYSTDNKIGIDTTAVYAAISASATPETPGPPHIIGTEVFANNGAQFVFVQASTSITASDFLAISSSTMQANSLTNTNVATAGIRIAVAPTATTGVTAGQYFWAAINGSNLQGNGVAATTTSNVQMYTSAVAGVISSVTGSSGVPLAGIAVIASATGVAQTVNLSWPRVVALYSSTTGTLATNNAGNAP